MDCNSHVIYGDIYCTSDVFEVLTKCAAWTVVVSLVELLEI